MFPPNSNVETLTPSGMVLGVGAFGWGLYDGVSTLRKRGDGISLSVCAHKRPCEDITS